MYRDVWMDEPVILDVRISRSGKYTIGGLYSYVCSVMSWVILGFSFVAYSRFDTMELISSLSGVWGQVGLGWFRELVDPLMINTCALI
jgi:hypothetical protein